jgi:hypothetical protein
MPQAIGVGNRSFGRCPLVLDSYVSVKSLNVVGAQGIAPLRNVLLIANPSLHLMERSPLTR